VAYESLTTRTPGRFAVLPIRFRIRQRRDPDEPSDTSTVFRRIQYDLGTLLFKGQVIIKGLNNQPFSAAGNSGSLIVERSTGRAVGLLFAGSASNTIANHIGDMFQALKISLA
jgi:hypothetical protein